MHQSATFDDLQVQRRRSREAFQYFEAALNRVTNYAPALLNQAVLSQQVQDRPFALQKYTAYLAVAPRAPQAEVIRAITNQLALELKPPSPVELAPDLALVRTGLEQTLRTASPPATVVTSPAPALARTTAPPATIHTAAPPALARTEPRPPPAQPTAPPPTAAPTRPAPPSPAESVVPPAGDKTTSPLPAAELIARPTAPPAPAPAAEPRTPAAKTPPPSTAPIETPGPPEVQPSEPPVVTVELAPEPEIKPAVDVALAQPRASAEAAPSPEPSPSAASAPAPHPAADESSRTEPTVAEETAKPKRSLFARLNPLNLIRRGDDAEKAREREAKRVAEQARKAEREARRNVVTPIPRPPTRTESASLPAAAPPTFPRYTYTSPKSPAAGNRAEAERWVVEGLTAHKAGRVVEARAAYSRAAQADPAHFAAQYNLAVAESELQNWPRALSTYEQALALNPADLRARYGFALALERAGYPLDAAAELEKVLARDPAHVEAHLALANLHATTLGNVARAREHYQRVLQLHPQHPQAAQIKRWLGPAYRR